jgi:hypothetical protein
MLAAQNLWEPQSASLRILSRWRFLVPAKKNFQSYDEMLLFPEEKDIRKKHMPHR